MASKRLFGSSHGLAVADTVNEAGGTAYKMEPRHALAQLVVTGTFNETFYTKPETQLDEISTLANEVTPEYLAKCAVYGRTKGYMKDTPSFLMAVLAARDSDLMLRIFDRVIDNGKMLRNFVQIVRSGAVGRKSFGTRIKRQIQRWLNDRSVKQLLNYSVGNDPSLADVIKMVHPRPADKARAALYAYLIGKEYNLTDIPQLVGELEAFHNGETDVPPPVEFRLLTAKPLTSDQWRKIAMDAPWHMARMNLNTFARHDALDDEVADRLAALLSDREVIQKAKVYPYQLMVAYKMAADSVPIRVTEALQDAMEIAIENVPDLGRAVVCLDTSGSMHSPVTGYRPGSTSAVSCVDVASLVASAVLRKNPESTVIPFDTQVHRIRLNPRDSVLTNAQKLSRLGGGGTDCASALRHANAQGMKGDLVLYVSDMESWFDGGRDYHYWNSRGATSTMEEWKRFRSRNPNAKCVCIDIQPYETTQMKESPDILNVGGFSDAVFDVIRAFTEGRMTPDHWVGEIENIEI